MRYLLRCIRWENERVVFEVSDPKSMFCGMIVVPASDALNFIARSWNGNLDWNGFLPETAINEPQKFGFNLERP